MSIRRPGKFVFMKRYSKDFFGFIASKGFSKKWYEDSNGFRIFVKNVKMIQRKFIDYRVQRILKKRDFFKKKSEQLPLQRRGFEMGHFKRISSFYFRVDIVNLISRRRFRSKSGFLLKERHKLRNFNTEITLRQFKTGLRKSLKTGFFAKNFYGMLETRLDIILGRLNFTFSVGFARQSILHNFFLVNTKNCPYPSVNIKVGDVVSVKKKSRKHFFFNLLFQLLARLTKNRSFLIKRFRNRKKFYFKFLPFFDKIVKEKKLLFLNREFISKRLGEGFDLEERRFVFRNYYNNLTGKGFLRTLRDDLFKKKIKIFSFLERVKFFSDKGFIVRQFFRNILFLRNRLLNFKYFLCIENFLLFWHIYRFTLPRKVRIFKRRMGRDSSMVVYGDVFGRKGFGVSAFFKKRRRNSHRQIPLNSNFGGDIVFSSLPYHLEVNYRIMTAVLVCNPMPNKLFYPFKINTKRILPHKGFI